MSPRPRPRVRLRAACGSSPACGPSPTMRWRSRGARPASPEGTGAATVGSHVVSARGLQTLTSEIVACRACPRLVSWREQVAREKRAAFRDEEYWGRPVPGFGDPNARLLLVGLAPAAH